MPGVAQSRRPKPDPFIEVRQRISRLRWLDVRPAQEVCRSSRLNPYGHGPATASPDLKMKRMLTRRSLHHNCRAALHLTSMFPI
jgi:hypothetical protein